MGAEQEFVTIFPLLARTATPTPSGSSDGSHGRIGGHFVIRTTAIGAAPSVVPVVEAQDFVSGVWYPLITGAAIVAISTVVLRIFPGLTPVNNLTVADLLPPVWRLVMTHGNADSITYSASAYLRDYGGN